MIAPRHAKTEYYIFVFALMIVLAVIGYPFPNGDDLFYTGAAISLAKGNGLVNPFLERYAGLYETNYFFQYPPLYDYVLSWWIEYFGIGVLQFQVFQLVCYCVVALSIPRLLSWFGVNKPIKWSYVITLVYCAFLVYSGLRPDGLGMAFFFLAVLFLTLPSLYTYFPGFLFFCLAFLSWPSLIFSILAVGGVITLRRAILRVQESRNVKTEVFAIMVALFTAWLLAFLVLEWVIEGRLVLFMNTFVRHARFSRDHWPSLFVDLAQGNVIHVVRKCTPLIVASLTACYALRIAYRVSSDFFGRAYLVIGAIIACVCGLMWHGNQIDLVSLIVFVCSLITIGMLEKGRTSLWGRILIGCAIVVCVIPAMTMPIRRALDAKNISNVRCEARHLEKCKKTFLVDSASARYVFDYVCPSSTLSYEVSSPGTWGPANFLERKDGDVWLISTMHLPDGYRDDNVSSVCLSIMGFEVTFRRFQLYRFFVISRFEGSPSK